MIDLYGVLQLIKSIQNSQFNNKKILNYHNNKIKETFLSFAN
jgi:hypothetical protein